MVEVTQEDRDAANSYLSPAKERTVDGLAEAFARHRRAGVQQGLDMAIALWERHKYNGSFGEQIRKLGANDGTD